VTRPAQTPGVARCDPARTTGVAPVIRSRVRRAAVIDALMFSLCAALWIVVACAPARADTPSAADVFQQANQSFAAAAREAVKDPRNAASLMASAIAGYSELIEQRGMHSAGLYYNRGNARFLAGDYGRAIADYRRAQRLDPTLADAVRNLAEARARVGLKIDDKAGARATSALLSWHTLIPPGLRLWTGAGAFAGVWLLLLLRLRGGGGMPPRWSAGALAAVAVLCAASLWMQHRAETVAPPGVIVEDRAVGRKGPDERAYEPSFTEPLRAGVEVDVLESRANWLNVRLGDGRTTWVPAGAVEKV